MNFTANAPDSRMSPTGDYSFGLSDRGDQFFLRATTDALGNRTYTYGTAIREHQHRGLIAYTDRGVADSGAFDSAAGTITIKIALSKLNALLPAGHSPIGPGSILAGLRGGTYTTGDDNAADRNDRAKSDIARGGTQYAINSAPTAVLVAIPTTGSVPLAVNFDGSASTDPDAGDTLTYTFNFGDGATVTQSGSTVAHTYNAGGIYTASLTVTDTQGSTSTNTAQVQITVNSRPVTECIEDDDARIAYSSGWHLNSSASASGGHFRLHSGKNSSHSASIAFTVPANSTGAFSYRYGKSTKGGTAEVFIDGVSRGSVNYKGTAGSDKSPQFSSGGVAYEMLYEGFAPGQHTFELRNMVDSVFVDGFCLTTTSQPQVVTPTQPSSPPPGSSQSSFSGSPTTGPGQTTSNDASLSGGQESNRTLSLDSTATTISVMAEASGDLPIKLVLVNPAGLTLQVAEAVNGVAVLDAPVTQGGLYTIKVVNISLGPVQVWTVSTPTVKR
jgi:PKD repeat protein